MQRAELEGHTALGFVFNSTLNLVQQRAGEEAARALQGAFFKKRPVDFLRYPAGDFLALIERSAQVLAPQEGSREAALRVIGKSNVQSFFDTTMGKLLLGIVGRAAPSTMMASAPGAYGSTFSWGERTHERLSATGSRLRMRQEPLPVQYHEGILMCALQVMEARNPRVQGQEAGPTTAEYTMGWD